MTHRTAALAISALIAATALSSTGCVNGLKAGVKIGPLAIPVPISPYLQKLEEDRFWNYERYERAPILGPILPGGPMVALDPPSDDEVMRSLEKANPQQGNFPFLWEKQRNNVRIVKEKIADYVDPPRVVPLLGPVQLHHAHYKCTVYYTEVTRVGWPVPHTLTDEDSQEVIYIDHNHFHMVGPVDTGVSANF
jgi:hypothetical protein